MHCRILGIWEGRGGAGGIRGLEGKVRNRQPGPGSVRQVHNVGIVLPLSISTIPTYLHTHQLERVGMQVDQVPTCQRQVDQRQVDQKYVHKVCRQVTLDRQRQTGRTGTGPVQVEYKQGDNQLEKHIAGKVHQLRGSHFLVKLRGRSGIFIQ